MNAATSRDVVYSTMAHLLICNDGTRFVYSHGFGNLLIGQLEATLKDEPIDVRMRKNVFRKKEVLWPDSSSDDYIYRPNHPQIDNLCSYQMCMMFKKTYRSFKEMNKSKDVISTTDDVEDTEDDDTTSSSDETYDSEDSDSKSESDYDLEDDDFDEDEHDTNQGQFTGGQGYKATKYSFIASHPGYHFSVLAKLKKTVIPKVFLPIDSLCPIEDLAIFRVEPTKSIKKAREKYALMALLMFYPFRKLEDLQLNKRHWPLYKRELDIYEQWKECGSHGEPVGLQFWKDGFQMLQNMEDRKTLDKYAKRARDVITKLTEPPPPEVKCYQGNDGQSKLRDISDFSR